MLADILRLGEGQMVNRLRGLADHVGALSGAVEKLSDAELQAKTAGFRQRHANGESLDLFLVEAFAVAREAARRVLDLRPYDVQVMGGAALHIGGVAEMMTGEGKTLASVLPVYLNALSGKGVHVVTVNDYLAKRDAEQMGRVHRFLGLDVGVILAQMKPDERRTAYRADITYGTNNEFGFDYLRDNMAHHVKDLVQRGQHYAVLDEVDSILIDEARTPLIISGPADDASDWYVEFARVADLMEEGTHYEVDLRKRTIGVHETGVALVEDHLGVSGSLYEVENSPLVGYLNNAVKAKELFHCNEEYIVTDDGEVLIVDEFTGRVLVGRRYNEGLHQAIEAKEGVEVKAENQTLATITLQNYFRLYDKLAGMTGTARTEAAELYDIYRLEVITIPPNKPVIRTDKPDVVYKSELAKFNAVVEEITDRYATGQPVLIGTTDVDKSEYLSRQLVERRIPHTVLNARHLEEEAAIVAEAGRRGAVTVATDMAGRGTDIVLGGNVDFLTDQRLRAIGLDPIETAQEYQRAWRAERPKIKAAAVAEGREVVALGGLYVLGTERHEARRIDNQLRGRSGRQGDPGETRFYLSLGDELMRRFSDLDLEKLMTRLKMPDDEPIKAKVVSRAIKSAQTQVEQQNFELRKNVLKYDEVMNHQRKVVYDARRTILEGHDLRSSALQMVRDVASAYINAATPGRSVKDWDINGLGSALQRLYPLEIDISSVVDGKRAKPAREALRAAVTADAERAFAQREAQVEDLAGKGAMRHLERAVILDVIDRKWQEHLYEMDYLKEGIGLRALAQRDPVVEYHREGYDMFAAMLEAIEEECVMQLFNAAVRAAPVPQAAAMPEPTEPIRPTAPADRHAHHETPTGHVDPVRPTLPAPVGGDDSR